MDRSRADVPGGRRGLAGAPELPNRRIFSGETVPSAAIAGFIATAAMSVAILAGYGLAASLGTRSPNAPVILRWMAGLAHNSLTDRTQTLLPVALGIHFLSGIAWALVYAAGPESWLRGPGWRRGITFSLLPWALSITVFFPLVGGGVLGFGFKAGPLPVLGNLVGHLIFGAVLGYMYGPSGSRLLTGGHEGTAEEELRLVARDERAIAVGIACGLVAGGLLGWLASAFDLVRFSLSAASLSGAVGGSLAGAFIASYLGLSQGDS